MLRLIIFIHQLFPSVLRLTRFLFHPANISFIVISGSVHNSMSLEELCGIPLVRCCVVAS